MPKASSNFELRVDYTDDELNQVLLDNAEYFTVCQVNRGGFLAGAKNYVRTEHPNIEAAKEYGEALYKAEGKSIIIYAVAQRTGYAFSRPVATFPVSTWMSKADKEKLAKAKRAEERARIREAKKAAKP